MSHVRHSFYTEDAVLFGPDCAIIIEKLGYYLASNLIDGRNIHDGRVWTYNSIKKWVEVKYFPYFTEKQLRTRFEKLIKAGVLVTGNYNKDKFNRDTWYAFADQEKYLGRALLVREDLPETHRHHVNLTLSQLKNSQPNNQFDGSESAHDNGADRAHELGANAAHDVSNGTLEKALTKQETTSETSDDEHSPKRANGNSQMGNCISLDGQMQLPKEANVSSQTGKSLQLTNTTNDSSNNPANFELSAPGGGADFDIDFCTEEQWKKIPKAKRDEHIEEWFDEDFWPLYVKLKSRDRIPALKKAMAISPWPGLQSVICKAVSIEIHTRKFAESAGLFMANPKYAKSWLHQACWNEKPPLEQDWYISGVETIDVGWKPSDTAAAQVLSLGFSAGAVEVMAGDFVVEVKEQNNFEPVISYLANGMFYEFVKGRVNSYRSLGLKESDYLT